MVRNRIGKKRKHHKIHCLFAFLLGLAGMVILIAGYMMKGYGGQTPEELLAEYMHLISAGKYEKMYQMIDQEAFGNVTREAFVKRNASIYGGIGMKSLTVDGIAYDEEQETVSYRTSLDTMGGEICFENEAVFKKGKEGYRLVWHDNLIFPELDEEDRVRVFSDPAERGNILDRNGRVLAGTGVASSVGIVPGKWKNSESAIGKIARLLEMEPETVKKKLSAKWVKEDSFVPLKTIPKVKDLDLLAIKPSEAVLQEKRRQEKLLAMSGVMLSDIQVREYPMGEAAAHLVGYVQGVTAEDLEKNQGEGYTANCVMGKSGAEALFEKELKGRDGCRICIVDGEGKEKLEMACKPVCQGKDVKLTIDGELQKKIYRQFRKDKSCTVAMNQYTGEVLALVSTPSFDNQDFVFGMTERQWKALSEDEGLSWRKDASWGTYRITTLHAYRPVILENALIYSDNIYFAKAALKIGAERMERSLKRLEFHQEVPFGFKMTPSQYANSGEMQGEIPLADSGYGQGEMLVNPLHMACLYSAFCNAGNVVKPYLRNQPEPKPEYWIPGAFSKEVADTILKGLKRVVNDRRGTGYLAHRQDVLLAGKTGTAEIKASKKDASGTELGWFAVFTADRKVKSPILMISMVEDVKGRGGSGYVVEKDRQILKQYLKWEGEQWEKGYDLPVDAGEKGEAERDCKKMMGLIQNLYRGADKGDAENVVIGSGELGQMAKALKKSGNPVIGWGPYANMENYQKFDTFLRRSSSGDSGCCVVYEMHPDGGIGRKKFIYDGEEMYVVDANALWGEGDRPAVSSVSYTQLKAWRYSKRGWLSYEYCVPEYPEVTERVDGRCLVRVKPISGRKRRYSLKFVYPLGYQGNNLLCSNWDEGHMEELDYQGLYEFFYEMKYQKKLQSGKVAGGIPPKKFEGLMMEYLPVTSGMIRKYAVYDRKRKVYPWAGLGCFNYELSYFGSSVPEVARIKKNSDGTMTLRVEAVCEMLGDEAVIAHELTVRLEEDGGFRYLKNRILGNGEKEIPEYSYRINE